MALVAAYTTPRPDRDSGSRRIDDMLQMLCEDEWSVTFVTTRPDQELEYVEALQDRGVAVFHLDVEGLGALVRRVRFDLAVLAFWPTGELFLPVLRRVSPQTPVIIDSVDLHFLRHARRILRADQGRGLLDERFGDQTTWELNTYAAADSVFTVSTREARLVDDLVGEQGLAHVVPDMERVPDTITPWEDRKGILFVGSFQHPPNRDAVTFLCREIVPLLPPDVTQEHPVLIVGNGLDDAMRALGRGLAAVRMVGWVPAVEPWFAASRVSVLPLLSGAGTKRKLIQSLMWGTPVVTTSVGAEGFDLDPGQEVIIADEPAAFAEAITSLIRERDAWSRISMTGREAITRRHGPEPARQALHSVIERVLAIRPKGPRLPPADAERHLSRLRYQYEQRSLASWPEPTQGSDLCRRVRITATGAGADAGRPGRHEPVRLIAFYLPQFHRIPENDAWWGDGFTEWTQVKAARPLFAGHRQPRVPSELGYYDLTDPEVRERQAGLAREHGIHGFCYYHYWFGGKRLLDRPFDEVLSSGCPDLPFALCWANEPWSRRWDGSDHDVLQPQSYSPEDDLSHIRWLLPALADPRGITVGGKPLLLIYQGHALPEPERLADTWRTEVAKAGLPGVHLLAVETGWDEGWDATTVGFDGKVRFQPQFTHLLRSSRLEIPERPSLRVFDYRHVWPILSEMPDVTYPTYETVFPGWDNTPRRNEGGVVVHGASPEVYERWLTEAIERATARSPNGGLVFINAWNEWAEGAYLEPDEAYGRGFLEATRRAAMLNAGDAARQARARQAT